MKLLLVVVTFFAFVELIADPSIPYGFGLVYWASVAVINREITYKEREVNKKWW